MNIPNDLKYTKTHEWVKADSDGTWLVGITDHAQDQLGDMVFVEPPVAGRQLTQGEECAVVESVKAAADIYAPVAGEVVEGNEALEGAPEMINKDPYGAWIFRLKPANAGDLAGMLDAAAYQVVCESEAH